MEDGLRKKLFQIEIIILFTSLTLERTLKIHTKLC